MSPLFERRAFGGGSPGDAWARFCVFSLFAGLFCTAIFPSAAQAAMFPGNGMMVYGKYGTNQPQYRIWSTTSSNWTTENAITSPTFQGNTRYAVLRTTEKRDEAIAGFLTTSSVLYVLLWNGSTWSTLVTSSFPNVSFGATQGFDIAYDLNGTAHIVIGGGVDPVHYTWNGTALSASSTVTQAGKTTGAIRWTRLASRTTGTPAIALAYSDANGDLNALTWNGTIWAEQTATTSALTLRIENSSGATSSPAFDLAYESLSGDLFVMWGENAQADPRFTSSTYGGVWGAVKISSEYNETPSLVELDPSPWSDQIAVQTQDDAASNSTDGDCSFWNGTATSTVTNCDTSRATQMGGDFPIAVGWVASATGSTARALAFYSDAPDNTLDFYYSNTTTTPSWGVSNYAPSPNCSNLGAPNYFYDRSFVVEENPFDSRELMIVRLISATSSDATANYCTQRTAYTGGVSFGFANAGAAPYIASSSVTSSRPMGFDYFRYNAVTVSSTGSQNANLNVGQPNQYIGGAFTMIATSGIASTTMITLTDAGTVNANANITNATIRYEPGPVCAYDGTETIFGTAASFNASEKASTTGGIAVGTSTIVCLYVEVDVEAGASGGQTLDIEISNPSTEVTVKKGVAAPATAVSINGSSTLQAAAGPSVSGICKQFDQSLNCGDGREVRVAVNGALQSQTGSTSGGTWTVSGLSQPAANDVITVFASSTTASQRAAAVTKYTSGDVSGVQLFEGHLVVGVGSPSDQTITNANLSAYDNSVAGNANAFWEVDASNNLNVDVNGVLSSERLMVRARNTYQPDPSGAQKFAATQHFYASSTATTTANGSVFKMLNGGAFEIFGNFIAGTSTVEFAGTGGTINFANGTFYNLTASSTAIATTTATATVANVLRVEGTLGINATTSLTATGTITLNGTLNGPGRLRITDTSGGPESGGILNAPVRYDASAANIASTVFDARTYGGLVEAYASSASDRTLTLANGAYTFSGGLNVFAGGTATTTLDASTTMTGQTVTVTGNLGFTGTGSGNEEIFGGNNTWAVSGSADFTGGYYRVIRANTIRMTGTGTLTASTSTLQNLEINSAGTVTLASGATTTLAGNLTLAGSGAPTVTNTTILMTSTSASLTGGGKTLNNLTIDPTSAGTITAQTSDLIIGGTLTVASGDTFSIASGATSTVSTTLTLVSNGAVTGAGRLTYRSPTAFPTTGSVSSTLRFDATNGGQTMSARAYGGNVEIFNSGGTGRTVVMAATNHAIAGSLDVQSTGAGTITVDGATNSASTTITGSVTFTGSGGTRTISTGALANTWSAGGNVNLSGGTYTAGAGNTLKLTGSSPALTTNSQTFQNLDISLATTPTVSGNVTAAGNVTLAANATLTGVTLAMTGQDKTLVGAGNALPNLTIDGTAASTTLSTSDLTVSGTLSVGADDRLNVGSSRALTAQGTISLPNGGTITGAGTLVYTGSTALPTTGTLSPTLLRFDATAGDQAIAARTYSTVEIENTGSSARNVVLGTGAGQTITMGALALKGTGSGGVTLTGATYGSQLSLASFAVTASANAKNYTTGAGTTTVSGNFSLSSIGTFTASAGHKLVMNGSSPTLTANGKTFESVDLSGATTPTISGNLTASGNVTLAANTTLTGVTLTMTGQNKTLVGAGNTLPNLTIDGAAATTTLSTSDFTISGTLAVGADDSLVIGGGRTLTHTGATLTLDGTISGAGTLRITDTSSGPGSSGALSSIVRYDASSANIAAATFDARTYNGPVEAYALSGTGKTLTLSSGNYVFNSGLLVTSAGAGVTTLDASAGNPTVDVNGDLIYFTVAGTGEAIISGTGLWAASAGVDLSGGTYTASAGNTFRLDNPVSDVFNSAGNTMWNLEVTGAGATTFTSGVTTTVAGNFTLSGGGHIFTGTTIAMTSTSASLVGGGKTLNNLTIDPTSAGTITAQTSDLIIGGTLTVASGDTFSIASGATSTVSTTLTLVSNGAVTGAGRLTYRSPTAFPTTGSVSSTLRFDATNGGQTMSARAYGGAVEIYNNSGSARTVTMAAGTYAFSSDLNLNGAGGGSLFLDGSTNNATGTITGNVSYTAGGGSESIAFSSAPWNVSGNLDISSGSFQAPAGILNLGGNFTNTGGTFTHNSGTVVLNGSSQQTLSGTMSGSSAFNNLTVTNNSGVNPDTSPSVIFSATTTAATFTAATASTSVRFLAGSTFTFTNVVWNGQSTASRVALRSSASPVKWLLNVSTEGTKTVTKVSAKDSDASPGDEIPAADGTNEDAGGNANWAFSVTAPQATSTADDTFGMDDAPTLVSNINVVSGGGSPGGKIASTTDIRVRIPSTFNATWDSTVVSITCAAGNACAKIATTSGVTYESGDKIAVVNALENFTNGQWVQIAGLTMKNFTGVNAATATMRLRVDGSGDTADDATDTRTKTIKGKLAVQSHGVGQIGNQFDVDATALTAAALFRFRVVPTGEDMSVGTTTVTISSVGGFSSGDLTNLRLFLDMNGNGMVDAGDAPVGATGTVSIAGATGTVTLGGEWSVGASRDVILRGDVAGIGEGESIAFSLSGVFVSASGVTTGKAVTPSGYSPNINHGKPVRRFGGGGYELPGGGFVGGGGASGGGEEPPPPDGGGAGGGGAGGGGGGTP